MKMNYVKFETPKEVADKALEALEIARDTGKTKKGTNEVTKAVERGNSALVFIVNDISPPEIVMHLPMICDEKGIPYLYAPKADIGEAVGIHVPTAAACIIDAGKAKDLLTDVVEKLKGIKK